MDIFLRVLAMLTWTVFHTEQPDRSPALPKFGAWDERDPSSGDGFTVIFNQAHNEKKIGGPVRIPALKTESPARMDQTPTPKRPQLSQQKYGTQKKASVSTFYTIFNDNSRLKALIYGFSLIWPAKSRILLQIKQLVCLHWKVPCQR